MTQLEIIKKKIKRDGEISRNYCLRNHITRLAARITDLRNAGWNVKGKKEGNDYVYFMSGQMGLF